LTVRVDSPLLLLQSQRLIRYGTIYE